ATASPYLPGVRRLRPAASHQAAEHCRRDITRYLIKLLLLKATLLMLAPILRQSLKERLCYVAYDNCSRAEERLSLEYPVPWWRSTPCGWPRHQGADGWPLEDGLRCDTRERMEISSELPPPNTTGEAASASKAQTSVIPVRLTWTGGAGGTGCFNHTSSRRHRTSGPSSTKKLTKEDCAIGRHTHSQCTPGAQGDTERLSKFKNPKSRIRQAQAHGVPGGAILADIMKDHDDKFWISRQEYQEMASSLEKLSELPPKDYRSTFLNKKSI
uniref:EF-hand domain-containing protein n=1 Tax=Macrostomum lignano TaxID=282301 RepID=A0A1I8F6J4_9PLAT